MRETEIEMVQRHVREGEAILAKQYRIITDIETQGFSTFVAEQLLANFEDTQRLHCEHLARLLARR